MKKIISMLLAGAMTLALAVPAYALFPVDKSLTTSYGADMGETPIFEEGTYFDVGTGYCDDRVSEEADFVSPNPEEENQIALCGWAAEKVTGYTGTYSGNTVYFSQVSGALRTFNTAHNLPTTAGMIKSITQRLPAGPVAFYLAGNSAIEGDDLTRWEAGISSKNYSTLVVVSSTGVAACAFEDGSVFDAAFITVDGEDFVSPVEEGWNIIGYYPTVLPNGDLSPDTGVYSGMFIDRSAHVVSTTYHYDAGTLNLYDFSTGELSSISLAPPAPEELEPYFRAFLMTG